MKNKYRIQHNIINATAYVAVVYNNNVDTRRYPNQGGCLSSIIRDELHVRHLHAQYC